MYIKIISLGIGDGYEDCLYLVGATGEVTPCDCGEEACGCLMFFPENKELLEYASVDGESEAFYLKDTLKYEELE